MESFKKKHTGKKLLLFLDGAKVNIAAICIEYLLGESDVVTLVNSAYSPQICPIEMFFYFCKSSLIQKR